MILITGASGQVGMHLLRALSIKGIETRAWIHSKQSEEKVMAAGATEVFIGDMNSYEDSVEAMKNIETIFYICSTANPKEDKIGYQLIDIAKKKGNVNFIYHSVLHSLLSKMSHHKKKQAVERALVNSGIPYVILQPAVFMQMLTPAVQSIKTGGPFIQKFYTSNQTKMSYVDLKDYADVATKIITAFETYVYGTYELCSEGKYTLTDMENIFTDLAGRKVTNVLISDSDFLSTIHLSADTYAGQTLLTMLHHYNEAGFVGNSFILTQILKHQPVTLREYLKNMLGE